MTQTRQAPNSFRKETRRPREDGWYVKFDICVSCVRDETFVYVQHIINC